MTVMELMQGHFSLYEWIPPEKTLKEHIDWGVTVNKVNLKYALDVDNHPEVKGTVPRPKLPTLMRLASSYRYESKASEETEEEIATPEEIHTIIQDTLKSLGATPKKKAPTQEPASGNIMEALPNYLKGLPEHEGTEDFDMPF